ncbi:hypothetical protein GFY24_09775 [Nocardia sp. SYP-A9097]|uniref:hypothetical protein n=1 Tax=Nocardia sp. SYP-A9097 TaxID=2663237 RepID=UPI00129B69EE|nr:hypothetical protein [Nocardia sp. SYP-A9097]MRH87737.1 hypothetical protein [Nocardia sp. SYP-A9097]
MDGLNQIMPGWVDPDSGERHTATYEYRLRGHTGYIYRFLDGPLTVDPEVSGRIDVHISAEPVTALLLNYGRIGPWRPTVTGQVLAWGRKPWLATTFYRRFLPARRSGSRTGHRIQEDSPHNRGSA